MTRQRRTARRIVVVGTSGSGKTTTARAIARRLGVPHVELDALMHQRDWQQLERDEFRRRVQAATSGDRWVVDGNYLNRAADITWPRAELLVWLDLPFAVVMWQVARRTFARIVRRTELWNGNRERLGAAFGRDSIVLWAATTWRSNRARYGALPARGGDGTPPVVRLRSRRAIREWLATLESGDVVADGGNDVRDGARSEGDRCG